MTSTNWKVHSAWSKAGVGTSIVLELFSSSPTKSAATTPEARTKKMPRIAFDMGSTPVFDAAISAKYVFLSHGHIDHVGGVFSHARAHSVCCGGEAPKYYAPAELVPKLEQCRDAMISLDSSCLHSEGRRESLIKANFVAVKPGDEIPLKGVHSGPKTSFFIRAFQVDHCGHPALGYVLGSRTTSGLKNEYKSLDKAALRDLAKSGVKIQADPIENIEVAYTGDTNANGLVPNSGRSDESADFHKSNLYRQQLFEAEIILCELTYLDSSESETGKLRAMERGHLHICELERIFTSKGNTAENKYIDASNLLSDFILRKQTQQIIFYHLSGRNAPAMRALDMIAEGLPRHLRSQCQVAIASILSSAEKTSMGRLIQPNGCISLIAYLAWKDRPK